MTGNRPFPRGEDRGLLRHLKDLAPADPGPDYELMAAYAFARRYVGGKTVADVCWGEAGRGSRLLAETASRVVGLARSAERTELAFASHPAPNVDYETADLPTLPHPENSFDVVVALGVVENLTEPELMLAEARRVLRPGGVFVVSVPDKAHDPRYRGGLHASEAEELLGRHFGGVRLYRHGAVAGGFVGPYSGETPDAGVRVFRSSDVNPSPGAGSPETGSILAVCGEDAVPAEEPLLLLDRDHRVFDEHEDLARNVGLMWEEVDRMQETEAQSFQDTLKLFKSEVSYLRARVRSSEAELQRTEARAATRIRQLEGQAGRLQDRIRSMESSATWRVFEPYRQLRSRIDAARSSAPADGRETDDGGKG